MVFYKVIKTPEVQVYDIPIIGRDIAKIGKIVDLFGSPCAPRAEVWAYAFFQAVPTFIVSLIKPEIIDINIRHRGRKNRKGRKLKIIPHLIRRDAILEIPVPRYAVFQLAEMAQRVGWYFLVMDATMDFAINWMSMAYQWTGCDDPDPPPYIDCHYPASNPFISDTAGWRSLNSWNIDTIRKALYTPAGGIFTLLEPCIPRFQLIAEAHPYSASPNARAYAWRIIDADSLAVLYEQETTPSSDNGSTVDAATIPIGEFADNARFVVQVYKNEGFLSTNGISFTCTTARSPLRTGFGPDP